MPMGDSMAQLRAEFLILELCDGTYSPEVIIGQMLASMWASGSCDADTIRNDVTKIAEYTSHLLGHPEEIWSSLMPGGIPADGPRMRFAILTMEELARMSGEMNADAHPDNIQLAYKIRVLFAPGLDTVLFADGAKVFKDEQDVQWIAFYAKNGPGAGKEHIMRTDQVVIVRDNGFDPHED